MLLTSLEIAGGVEELRRILGDATSRTVFDFDLSNPEDPLYKMNLLLAAKSLSTAFAMKPQGCCNYGFRFIAEMVAPKSDEKQKFLMELLPKMWSLLSTNQFGLQHNSREIGPDYVRSFNFQDIGSGLFPFASLFNHSCDPNVKYITVDNKLAFVVSRPITAGKQLFISYGPNPCYDSRRYRQAYLKIYGFKCDCDACINDYPVFMKPSMKNRMFILPKLQITAVKPAIEKYKRNCEYIQNNSKNHPCFETFKMMENNDHLLREIAKLSFDDLNIGD